MVIEQVYKGCLQEQAIYSDSTGKDSLTSVIEDVCYCLHYSLVTIASYLS